MENIKTRSSKYDPLNNFLFYKIFGEKGDEVQLLSFINAVLGKTEDNKFTSVEILENKSFMAEIMGGKSCVLDVRAKMPNGAMVNVEVQIKDKKNIDRRSLFYLSKTYTQELSSGHDYIKLPNVIAINIVNYDFPATRNFHSCFRLREDTEREIILTEALEIHFVNMVRYRELARGLSNNQVLNKQSLNAPLFRWLAWLEKSSAPELLLEVVKMDTTIKTADERMEHVTQSEEDMWAYTRYMMAECDRTAEINYGIDKGIEKYRQYTLELLDQGLPIEEIKQRLKQKKNN